MWHYPNPQGVLAMLDSRWMLRLSSCIKCLFFFCREYSFFCTVKWDLRKVAAAFIYRDYSLAHQGLSGPPQTLQPLQTWRCRGRQWGTKKKKKALLSSCRSLVWIKAAVSVFHAILGSSLSLSTWEHRRTPWCRMQNTYCLHKPTEVIWISEKNVTSETRDFI